MYIACSSCYSFSGPDSFISLFVHADAALCAPVLFIVRTNVPATAALRARQCCSLCAPVYSPLLLFVRATAAIRARYCCSVCFSFGMPYPFMRQGLLKRETLHK
jgi:hypothetical protein